MLVLHLSFEDNIEQDQVDAATNSFVHDPQCRLVVTRKNKLELRNVFEPVLPHEACTDRIATRQHLDTTFSPTMTFLGFASCYQPGTTHGGKVSRVAFIGRCFKRLYRCGVMVVSHDASHSLHQGAFTIATGTEEEEEDLFSRQAG